MTQQLYHLITPYKCPQCHQDMLFFTTKNDRIIDYKKFIDSGKSLDETKEYLAINNIRFLKCIYCDRSYIIDWTNRWPVPLIDVKKLKAFGV